MIGRLAWRSLLAHPLRSAVLSAGFGVGVAVMAILLGVAEVVLEQARSPALVGGGNVVIRLPAQVPARFLLTGTLQSDALRGRIRVAAPSHTTRLHLIRDGGRVQVEARGGIPSLERALGDTETGPFAEWRDTEADVAWTHAAPDEVLRHIDRFHAIPEAPAWSDSWAEWLYFNGRVAEASFYLTFLVGPAQADGRRVAGVRLQLDRGGRVETFGDEALMTEAEVQRAPDLTIGSSSVRLDGLRYHLHVDLGGASGRRARGDLTIEASAGRLVPPLEITGARGWRSGYVVPVMSGALGGAIEVGGERVDLDEGTGYHDHNWGFWRGVSWQWGQAQQGELSVLYGRVFPPAEAADPSRVPGFVGVLGRDGPLGFATDATIAESDDERGQPQAITVEARSAGLDVRLRFDVASAVTTSMSRGPLTSGLDFLQLRGQYTVSGRAGSQQVSFTAPGSAETFRGR
jgi:hypothetical protein